MDDVVVGLYGTREPVQTWRVGNVTVYASSDGIWIRGSQGVMSPAEVDDLRDALHAAQAWYANLVLERRSA